MRDAETLARIKALAVPPAYHDVWICPYENGHIQATGYDDRGRKQYRYHPRWHEVRDENKYARMLAFGEALSKIRARALQDLQKRGMPREKVLGALVQLLEKTSIRVGNEEYARENKSYGLTTMRSRHAEVKGTALRFKFRGKSGQTHDIELRDRRLARIVAKLQELPGQELFQYLDENDEPHSISSDDVNHYLKEISGQEFTAKDFRTWTGTLLASLALQEIGVSETKTQAKHNIVQAIEAVAKELGNTPDVCRKGYVHPAVLEAYLEGTLAQQPPHKDQTKKSGPSHELKPEEAAVMDLIRRWQSQQKTA